MTEEIKTTEATQPQEINLEALQAEIIRLRNHNETLLSEKRAKAEQAKQAEAERQRLEQEKLRQSGDIEKLEQSYVEKLQALEQRNKEYQAKIEQDLLNSEAQKVASELTDDQRNQRLLKRFIQDRLVVTDGQVRATDHNGQPVNRVDELITEFKASGDYDSLITGTKASGTGATGKGATLTKQPSDYTEAERVALMQSNYEQFKALFLNK